MSHGRYSRSVLPSQGRLRTVVVDLIPEGMNWLPKASGRTSIAFNLLLLASLCCFLCGGLLISASISALFVMGDSSVANPHLVPDLIGHKLGCPLIPHFTGHAGILQTTPFHGINFGSPATILGSSNTSLDRQLQLFDSIRLIRVRFGHHNATNLLRSSLFYVSLGTDDFISGVQSPELTKKMVQVIKNLYKADARKIVWVGIAPIGCVSNSTLPADEGCFQEIDDEVLRYNSILWERIQVLNRQLIGARIVFCDLYKGVQDIIEDPSLKQDVSFLVAESMWSGRSCRPTTLRELATT